MYVMFLDIIIFISCNVGYISCFSKFIIVLPVSVIMLYVTPYFFVVAIVNLYFEAQRVVFFAAYTIRCFSSVINISS